MEPNSNQVTVKELDEICEKIAAKEREIEAHEAVLTEHNKELAALEGRAVQYLKELGRESYDAPAGKIKIEEKWRVNLPATDQEKTLLFDHLRERGIFDKYATVNANSLNSLYKADWDAAKARGEGMEFSMPGIGAPKLFEKPNFKAAKVK